MSQFAVVTAGGNTAAGPPWAALVLFGVMGMSLVTLGRMQRRSGRHPLTPSKPFPLGDVLHEPLPPRRHQRVIGGFFEVLGWILVALALLAAVVVLRDVLS